LKKSSSRVKKFMITKDSTTQILVLGSSLTSLFIGLKMLRLIDMVIEPITNGIMMIVLGLVFLSEFMKSKSKDSERRMSDIVVLILFIPSIVFGSLEIIGYTFSENIYGAIGLLYITLTGVMLFSVYGKKSKGEKEKTGS